MALAVSACGGGNPPARGFGSHEIEPTRDSTLSFLGDTGPGVLIYETGGTVSTTPTYWSLNLATGAVQDFGDQFPPSSSPSMPEPSSPYTCALSLDGTATNAGTLEILDNSSGTKTDVPNVVSYALCPGADGILFAFVVDAGGNIVLSTGPFADLQPVPLPLVVSQIDWWQYGNVTVTAPSSVTVQAAAPSVPDEVGLYTIDLASYAITTDVPAVPASAAWATGATPAGSLQSTSVTGGGLAILALGDHYLYPRVMSDGATTMFAGPFPTGAASELALFQVPPGTTTPAPEGVAGSSSTPGYFQPYAQLVSWQLGGAAGASSGLVVWDDTNQQVIACPSSPNAFVTGQRSPDGSKVLFVTPQQCCSYGGSGPLSLLTLAASQGGVGVGSCTLLVASNVVTAAFSPDGSFMFWLVQPPAGEMQLWIAASDGSGAHMIGSGLMQNVHFIAPGGAKLELILDGDLVWFDLHDSTVNLHYVAEQVFEEIYDVGGAWLITGYDYTTQDNTGTLGLVNRDTGEKRPLSSDVAQFTIRQEKVAADGGVVTDSTDAGVTPVLSVVYLVRGRNPSPQDGIWIATLTAADLK
jgi:hypothetical protein